MAPWLDEYMEALDARDEVEKANHEIYTAYARLADRTAGLVINNSAPPVETTPAPTIRPSSIRSPASPPPPSASLATDLAAAQNARSSLQTQLSNLQTSNTKTVAELSKLRTVHATLTTHHTTLQTRLRDRDSELRGKTKLLENLQDELATTEMELTVQSREMQRLREENQALVDRWMKKIEGEAEEMNVALEGGERRRRRSQTKEDLESNS